MGKIVSYIGRDKINIITKQMMNFICFEINKGNEFKPNIKIRAGESMVEDILVTTMIEVRFYYDVSYFREAQETINFILKRIRTYFPFFISSNIMYHAGSMIRLSPEDELYLFYSELRAMYDITKKEYDLKPIKDENNFIRKGR